MTGGGSCQVPPSLMMKVRGPHMHTQNYFSNAPRFVITFMALHQFRCHLQVTTKEVHYLEMGVPFAKRTGVKCCFQLAQRG